MQNVLRFTLHCINKLEIRVLGSIIVEHESVQ